jgi:hypothetical protein
MDIGFPNLGAVTAQSRVADAELAAVSRIENTARARGYSANRKPAAGRQDTDLLKLTGEGEPEEIVADEPDGKGGNVNYFA